MPYEEGGKPKGKGKYPNSGALWRNEEKEDTRHKDFGGQGSLTCPFCQAEIELWLSSWIKYSNRTGDPFLSLSMDPKIQSGKRRLEDAAPHRQIDASAILRPLMAGQKTAPAGSPPGPRPPPAGRNSAGSADPTGFDDLPSRSQGADGFDDDIPF